MIESIDPFQDWDASYVLGALSQEESVEYEKHLATCASCSVSLAAISHLPRYLARIDTDTALSLIDGASLNGADTSWDESQFIKRLAVRAQEVQRRDGVRRKIGLVAAIVISLTVGVTSGVVLHAPHSQNGSISNSVGKSLRVNNLHPEIMSALFRVTSRAWGTQITWSCTYASGVSARYSSTNYDLFITDTVGKKSLISTWSASGSAATGLAASTKLQLSHLKSVEIVLSGSQEPLVVGTNI